MQTKYTRHAKQRMKWRKISESDVQSVLQNPDKIIKSKTDRKITAQKKIRQRLFEIIYVVENKQIIIITVIDKSD